MKPPPGHPLLSGGLGQELLTPTPDISRLQEPVYFSHARYVLPHGEWPVACASYLRVRVFSQCRGDFITRGWNAVPWVAWLLMSAGAFVMSLSEADTPPARSRGLILVYVIAFAAVALGAVLLLIDMGRHPYFGKIRPHRNRRSALDFKRYRRKD
jgi:hypothetical protein